MGKKMDLSTYKKKSPLKHKPDEKTNIISSEKRKAQERQQKIAAETAKEESKTSSNTKEEVTDKVEPLGIRLNRYIAHCGVCSRREADVLIADGKISVNKKTITEMGFKVMPGDRVFMGKKQLKKEDYAYVLLNKPKDFITTTKDTHDRKTVMDLIKRASDVRLYPIGRLDRNTTGLLLLTNDGDLADRLSHPSNNIRKIYKVEIDKPIESDHLEQISAGFSLDDGPVTIDEIAVLTADNKSIGIEIHSGRNRVVRRIFEHFDYKVERLDRTVYAGLTKANLTRGKWRHLSEKEVGLLKKKGKKRN
jgi:23S rRNA pseudouridine2605 synthase